MLYRPSGIVKKWITYVGHLKLMGWISSGVFWISNSRIFQDIAGISLSDIFGWGSSPWWFQMKYTFTAKDFLWYYFFNHNNMLSLQKVPRSSCVL